MNFSYVLQREKKEKEKKEKRKKNNTFLYYLALGVFGTPAKRGSVLSVQPCQDRKQLSHSLLTCMTPIKALSIYADLLHPFTTY